jgi:uncharacterized protein DUF4158
MVMRREWELEDLIDCWTLDDEEARLLANKAGATRLGFALMLKFFEQEARFPRREDIPRAAIGFVAGQAFLQQLKEDPGPIQLDTLLKEIGKLERVRAVGLPPVLFDGVSEKIVAAWRARHEDVPLGLRRRAPGDPADVAGRAVPHPPCRDH